MASIQVMSVLVINMIALIYCYSESDDDSGFCPISGPPSDGCSAAADEKKNLLDDDGGWYTDVSKLIVHEGGCNVERLDSLSQEDFIENYAYKKPFIVKNSNDNTKFREFSRRQTMLEQFGDKIVRLSTANTYSYGKKDVALKEYIEKILKPQGLQDRGNETFYWFGDNNHTEWSEVFAAYHPPPLHIPKMSPAFSYGLAGAGTGVPFHFHGPGFSEVIYGSKRWFLYPFEMTPEFDPDSTTLHWVVEKMPFLPDGMLPLDCTIKPGEALYFPDRWWHATLNVNTSVFISTFLG